MLQVGKTLGVERAMRGPVGQQFESVTVHLLDGVRSVEVRVGREFDQRDLPGEGDMCVLDVVASAYKTRDGQARVQVTALRRDREVESLLFEGAPLMRAVGED